MNEKFRPTADARLRVEAALDGELDAVNMAAFENELEGAPELRAYFDRQAAARDAVRRFAPRERAPLSLRVRVSALAGAPNTSAPRMRLPVSLTAALAASLAAVAVLGALLWALRFAAPGDDPDLRALVSGYMRGQVSGQPFDVASSDRHTVKPWLASRVTLGAAVFDLSGAGFSLAGGRVDIVDRTPVPTLVYRRREHLITVSELPIGRGERGWRGAIDGYHVERWADSERIYVAISDLDASDLAAFASAFRDARGSSEQPTKP